MYKALIVDDEKMIRMGMRNSIPWDSIGIGEVFTAKSGKEALKIVKENMPEIMITDIKMDEMTGLDLIEEVKKYKPDIRVLVLTGYDKFEYASQCIKLKVHDFFLKPVDEGELIESLKKQVSFLKKNTIDEIDDINVYRARAVAEQMEIEKFLRDLLHNRLPDKESRIKSFCEKYGYEAEQCTQAAILVPALCPATGEKNDDFVTLSIKNICMGMVDAQNRGFTLVDDFGRIVIVFFADREKGSILEWVKELSEIFKDEYNKKPRIVVGNPVRGFTELRMSYNDAVYLLNYEKNKFGSIIQTKSAIKRDRLFTEEFSYIKNSMCSNIGDSDKVLSKFEQFCQITDSYNLSDNYIRKCCYELVLSVYFEYITSLGEPADPQIITFINSLINVKGEELLELTRAFLKKLFSGKEEQNIHEIVDKAKSYIGEHLSDDLSVSKIAEHLYVTPNYLSRLFKKFTGMGCNEYIVHKRIEKAKILLETTNIKTSKIAEMVGYNDPNYFSLAIKKHTGMSPTKYRMKFRKNCIDIHEFCRDTEH